MFLKNDCDFDSNFNNDSALVHSSKGFTPNRWQVIAWSSVGQDMWCHIDSLVQERRSSIANALELRLSCINPWIWCHQAAMSYFFPQLQVHEKDARNVLDMQNVLRLQEEEVHHLRQDKDDLRVISDTQKQRMHVSCLFHVSHRVWGLNLSWGLYWLKWQNFAFLEILHNSKVNPMLQALGYSLE